MKEVVVRFQSFIFRQTAFIKESSTGEIQIKQFSQKELIDYITSNEEVKTVHLFGNEKLVRKIKEDCLTNSKFTRKVTILINR